MPLQIGGHASLAYGAIEGGSDKPKIQRFCPTEGFTQYKEMLIFILAIQDLHEPHNLYMDSLYMPNLIPHLPGAHVFCDANPISPLMVTLWRLLKG